MYNKKKYGIVGVILAIIILIVLFILTNIQNSKISYFENMANKIVMPIQNGLTYLKNKINGNSSFFANVNNLKQDNENLHKKNTELEEKLRELESIKAQNESLKQYLNLKEKYSDYVAVPADVINRDISNYSKNIVINIGSKDGIKEGMTVIAAEGLVGHVISVTNTTSKVQTIIDSASSTSALISTSRDSIVCKGILNNDNSLKAMYIPMDATVSQGDSIETSGLGGIYQKGIYIGNVEKVENTTDLTNRYALVSVAVNFKKLETVLVITNN